MRTLTSSVGSILLLLLAAVCSASMCIYWTGITRAVHALPDSSLVLKPRVHTDFYPSWYATRELLLHRLDPYGAQVNRDLQIAYYGKELDPSRPEEQRDQQRFVYPLYFTFIVAPTASMEFNHARVVFWWVLAACAVASVLLWLHFIRLRLSWFALLSLFAMFLTSVPVIQNLSILQPFLLPACFLAAAAAALGSGYLFLAGVLLAVATVKPQICLLPLAWCALWVGSDWLRRRSLFLGFAVALTTLLLASEWLFPGWLTRYPGVLRAYAGYTKTTSFLGVLLTSPLRWVFSLLLLAIASEFCWRVRKQPGDSSAFAVALSFTLTLTCCIVPAVVQPFNLVLLLPVILLSIRYWRQLRQRNAAVHAATSVFCFCTFLPWLLAVVAISNPLMPQKGWLLKVWSAPLIASMMLPFAAFGVLVLLRNETLHSLAERAKEPQLGSGSLAAINGQS